MCRISELGLRRPLQKRSRLRRHPELRWAAQVPKRARRWQAAEESIDPLEESAEVGCRAVERHGVEQFEAAGEGVLEGVGRPRPKLLISGFSPVPPHFPCEVFGGVELVFDERLEDGKPRLVVRDLDLLPCGNLDLHRLESALSFVDADGYGVLQQEVFRMLGEDDIEVAGKRQI